MSEDEFQAKMLACLREPWEPGRQAEAAVVIAELLKELGYAKGAEIYERHCAPKWPDNVKVIGSMWIGGKR